MRIVHVSTTDCSGGAAISAWRLHRGLLALGADSRMFVLRKFSSDPTVIQFRPKPGFLNAASRWLRNRRVSVPDAALALPPSAGGEYFTGPRSRFGAEMARQIPDCDVLNLHWTARFADLEAVFARFGKSGRIVWTLHDMNAFTGGCHYDEGCGRYRSGCEACPLLQKSAAGRAAIFFRRKEKLFQNTPPERLCVVAPSRWLNREASQSPLLRAFGHRHIPYGLDLSTFRPLPRAECRKRLNLPAEARIVLFIAHSARVKRKGFSLLREALTKVSALGKVALVSISADDDIRAAVGIPEYTFRAVNEEARMAELINAANVFAIPSLQDNLPNTALEALACGVPVAGFASGGIPDLVQDGVTGFLAPPADTEALAGAIRKILSNAELSETLSANCRARAVADYAPERQAQAYLDLYAEMLGIA